MAYGFDNPYGTGSGNASGYQQDSQQTAQSHRRQLNRQRQSRYAADNGMNFANQPPPGGAAPAPTGSPVTPTGQINPQAAPAPVQPSPAPMSPYGKYPGRPADTMYQYQGSDLMDAGAEALMYALQNPVMGPDVVNAMKGSMKDQSALMGEQLHQQIDQNAAGRGTFGSGAQMANERRLDQGLTSELLNSYRDIDINAAQMNRDDLYRGVSGALGFTQGEEDLWRQSAGMGLQNYQTDLDAFFNSRGLDIQRELGLAGIDAQRFDTRSRTALGLINALFGYQQGLDQTGLGYADLNSRSMQALWNSIMGGMR